MFPTSLRINGFKLGHIVGDSYALQADPANESHVRTLHALKGLASAARLMDEFGAFGINGKIYVRGE